MKAEIIVTADGSNSLHIKELGEGYHSIHGAIQESMHVFVNAGLRAISLNNTSSINNEITILEIGLGTGLNVLLSLLDANKNNQKINYIALEPYPIEEDIANELNYAQLLSNGEFKTTFENIHTCNWSIPIKLSDNFTFLKIKRKLQDYEFENKFNLIYFDAFGPLIQPEMWTEETFSKVYLATQPNGILVTYCAKGEVKRILKKVGFTVESLKGPPGKREMIRAIKLI